VGSPTQLTPRSSVRTIAVHAACPHGAAPSTNASSAETNVTEVAAKPASSGAPAVVVGVGVAVAVTGWLFVAGADLALAVLVAEDPAEGPLVLEPRVPHPVSAIAVAAATDTSASCIARVRDDVLIAILQPQGVRDRAP